MYWRPGDFDFWGCQVLDERLVRAERWKRWGFFHGFFMKFCCSQHTFFFTKKNKSYPPHSKIFWKGPMSQKLRLVSYLLSESSKFELSLFEKNPRNPLDWSFSTQNNQWDPWIYMQPKIILKKNKGKTYSVEKVDGFHPPKGGIVRDQHDKTNTYVT